MRTHTHRQNRDDKRGISRLWHWWLYSDDEKDLAHVDVQFVRSFKPQAEFGARFHLGTRGSETPIDAHLTVAGTGVYVSGDVRGLRQVAHALTRGKGRDLSLSLYSGQFWWRLWTHDDHCNGHNHWSAPPKEGGKYRPWRCRTGNLPANPMDVAYGPSLYSYEDLDAATATVTLPEGSYEVLLRLQRVTRGRKGRTQRYQYLSADWECKGGIPWHYDHSGGWKGTGVWGSSVRVPDGVEGKDWPSVAVAQIAAEAIASRVRTGWTPEHEAAVGDQ